jgi:siroheme synthase
VEVTLSELVDGLSSDGGLCGACSVLRPKKDLSGHLDDDLAVGEIDRIDPPGVSSSLAVPAACSIPVTHREISKSFTVISGHTPPHPRELEGLVRLGGTIVILMGISNLTQIVAGLCRAGLDPATPAAVIERGFSDAQRSATSPVAKLPAEVRRLDICSPAVVVIGNVVAVSPQFVHSAEVIDAFGHRRSQLRRAPPDP